MLAAVGEFLAVQTDARQVSPHGEFFVFGLRFSCARFGLRQSLFVHREGKGDVGANLAGVQRRVESAKLHGVIAVKKTVQVEERVPAGVVMRIAVSAVAGVPNLLDLCEGFRSARVHAAYQIRVQLFAPAFARRLDLQGFVKKVVPAGDDVHPVANAQRGVRRAVEVDVDSAVLRIGECARFAKPADELLQRVHVLAVGQDRRDQLDLVVVGRANLPSAFLAHGVNARVPQKRPFPSAVVVSVVAVVAAAVGNRAAEEGCRCVRSLFAGDARELDLDAESCGFHACSLLCFQGFSALRCV